MIEDWAAQAKVWLSLLGAAAAAGVASLARNIYHADGFSWKRVFWDLPFAVTCAILAGSIGAWLKLEEIIVYGISGALAYLGPQWLDGWLRRKADSVGKDGDNVDGAQ